jgi:hypothetical protein
MQINLTINGESYTTSKTIRPCLTETKFGCGVGSRGAAARAQTFAARYIRSKLANHTDRRK